MNKSKPDTKIQSPDYCMTTLFSLQPDAYSLTLGNHYTRLKIYKHMLKGIDSYTKKMKMNHMSLIRDLQV